MYLDQEIKGMNDGTGLRGLSLDELAARYDATDDDTERAAIRAECERLDQRDRDAARRERVYALWHEIAYAAYLQAEEECRGELVSRAGVAAKVRDGFALWSGPRWLADLWATEELRDWWDLHGRLTISDYRRQLAVEARAAREQAEADLESAITLETILIAAHWGIVIAGGRRVRCPHKYGHESTAAAEACARRVARSMGLQPA